MLYWRKLPYSRNEARRMKVRVFWISLVVIGISWVANAFYAQSKMLEEPIFLNHAIHEPIQQTNQLTLYYLTNAADDAYVSSASSDPFIGYRLGEESTFTLQTFSHYKLNQVILDLQMFDQEDETIQLEALDVSFSDGRRMTVPIGELVFYPYRAQHEAFTPRGSSSSDTWSMSWLQAEEDLTIEAIDSQLSDEILQYVDLTVNTPSIAEKYDLPNARGKAGVDFTELQFPVTVKKGENLYISWSTAPEFTGVFSAPLLITGTTASEENFIEENFLYNQLPYLNNDQMKKLVEERGNR